MVRHPHGVRVRTLAGVAVVAGGLSWIALRLWTGAGHLLPPTSWATLGLLVVLGVGLYLAGRPVRRLVRGTATRPVNPLYAARVLVLAQATALAGAAAFGWYAAQALLLLPDADVESQLRRVLELGALSVGTLALSWVGLAVQRMCRIDDGQKPGHDEDEDEHEDEDEGTDRAGGGNGYR